MLVAPAVALKQPLSAAAANWHVLAHFAGRYMPHGPGLLVDIGSTTCDIIPLADGKPATAALRRSGATVASELVYTGVERSPVCALVNSLPWRKQQCPVAHELFATRGTLYLMLGDMPEELNSTTRRTAGPPQRTRPATGWPGRSVPIARCSTSSDAMAAAEAIARSQLAKIAVAIGAGARPPARPAEAIVISGRGEFRRSAGTRADESRGEDHFANGELGPALSPLGHGACSGRDRP